MESKQLNKRQEKILELIQAAKKPLAAAEVLALIKKEFSDVARITVVRDLRLLTELDFLEQRGKGRGVIYELSKKYNLLRPIDVDAYFKIGPDDRPIQKKFNWEIFSLLGDAIFDKSETKCLQKLNHIYQNNIKKFTAAALKKEFERLTIELSWKSSLIEGNTYTLLETEHLLKEQKEPRGHTREETQMILNHKKALDYIREHADKFKRLTLRNIEDVHYLLVKNLGVERNLRRRLVRVAGTAYTPLDNGFQIKEAMEKMCKLINSKPGIFDKALISLLLIAYIQPFEDGNKRTSRLIGNAILLAHNGCPLSYRSMDEMEYKKAVLLFYEQNNACYFKKLFINQFQFAIKNYFG